MSGEVMSDNRLGQKHTCYACGANNDLNRETVACPRCGANQAEAPRGRHGCHCRKMRLRLSHSDEPGDGNGPVAIYGSPGRILQMGFRHQRAY